MYTYNHLKKIMKLLLPFEYFMFVWNPTPSLNTPPVSLTYRIERALFHSGIPLRQPTFKPNIIKEPVKM